MTGATLAVQDVSFGYPGRLVLSSIHFTANKGEFIVLLGKNGAGKSSLLNILAGFGVEYSGSVRLDGRDLMTWSAKERSRRISHLPQGIRQELPFTAEQVVLMGRYAYADRWFESAQDKAHAHAAMLRMDCIGLRERLFSSLSGGEQQRVLVASCIAQDPAIMLLDEPSTYLDVHQQIQCFRILAELAREGALCIAITHDVNLALAHCTRILVVEGGRLAADSSVQDAAHAPEWLSHLSPELRMSRTPDGRPWVFF